MTKKMVFDPKNEKILPDGSRHLYGTFFKVPFSSIRTPEESDDLEDEAEYKFFNPRLLTQSGANELLFGKKSAAELRESIKNRTLLNPLVCRWQQEGNGFVPVLVGGDRRYRAIDWLIKNNESVVDPRNCQFGEDGEVEYALCLAQEAYESVVCQIFAVNDDLEALAISWAENKNRINLTDGHEIAEVIKLRKFKASDSTILEILQRDEKWLAETDRLISNLDTETLSNLLEGRIDRSAALNLLQISDQGLRQEILAKANNISDDKHKKKKEKIQKIVESALDEKEEAEGYVADCEYLDDEEGLEEAKQAVTNASDKVKKSIKKRDSIKPVTTTRDVNKAKSDLKTKMNIGGEEKLIRCLSARKINIGIDYITELLRDDGVCHRGKFKADIDALRLVMVVLRENILENDGDFAKTFETFFSDSMEPVKKVLNEQVAVDDPDDDEYYEEEDDDDDYDDGESDS